MLAVGLWLGALAADLGRGWIAATELPPLIPETSVQVLARDGTLLRAFTVADGRWRLAVTPDQVDPLYLRMLLAYEDRRFFTHGGVDARAMLRALWQAAQSGRVISGGSTLTMQVARLLEDGTTGELAGKLRQIRVALALEARLTKAEILEIYLQLAPFGGNLEGIRAASFAYLGREPRRLTPAEAALLVALPQSPELRRPDRHHSRAVMARDRVLHRMLRHGVIDHETARTSMTERVPDSRRAFPALAPHLADRLVTASPATTSHQTTLDANLQARLERLAADAVRGLDPRAGAAIVVADHATGEILATVGSAGFTDDDRAGFVDMTLALRSPGSTLKPLVYGLAFDDGMAHPASLIEDRPILIGGYAPQNFDRVFRGTLTLREALEQSLNIPVVLLTDALGPARLMAALRRAGVDAALPGDSAPGLAVALGGVGVTLEGLVQLYAALARGGSVVALRATSGASGDDGTGARQARVMGPAAAWMVGDILAGAPPPPGAPANRLAYKTGTSYGHRDTWALGYDGAHVAGVWIGRADGTPLPGAFAADLAAPVLFEVFARLKPVLAPLEPPPPQTLLVPTAALPAPLQRFRPRGAVFGPGPDAPAVAFPPDGAQLEAMGEGLLLRVARGAPPFTWLADGMPIAAAQPDREVIVPAPGPGFVTLSVVDARGRAARSRVWID